MWNNWDGWLLGRPYSISAFKLYCVIFHIYSVGVSYSFAFSSQCCGTTLREVQLWYWCSKIIACHLVFTLMEFVVKDHTQGCQDKAEFGTVPVLCWSGALLQVSPSCIPTGWTLRTTGQPGFILAKLKESQTARILSVMGIVWGVMKPRYGIYDSVGKDVQVLPFNCLNPSERFENKLRAGLLFFPYGSLYVFLTSTMALQILSLVMFISSLFGKYLESHSDTCGTPSHLPSSRN